MRDVSPEGQKLVEQSRGIADATREALVWLEKAGDDKAVQRQRNLLTREFRRTMVQANRLEAAAQKPMAVAVFGPSQVGKSHLISVLARTGEAQLVRFAGHEPINYIERINPDKGKEATGLVTRFTVKERPSPPGFPVCLRLLEHIDIIKIIANSYFFEGNPGRYEAWPSSKEIEDHLAQFPQTEGVVSNGLKEEDIWDLAEYFQKYLAESELTKRLAYHWDQIARCAIVLPIEQLGELLSILWGRHKALTDLYKTLTNALQRMHFTSEAFVPLDGIDAIVAIQSCVPSILDVECLSMLGDPDGPTLSIYSPLSGAIELPRAVVCALTAELLIVLLERPWEFLDVTDLLDFPGYRGRELPNIGGEELAEEEVRGLARHFATNLSLTIQEMMLRGKVEYLFQRYSAEQEITAMLLCVKESNMDIKKLPDVVASWIGSTHGVRPSDRSARSTSLFFILTRFDVHFEERDSDRSIGLDQRFVGRLQASLVEPFGKTPDSWVQNWDAEGPFRNCFLMRNPNIKNKAIFEVEGTREIAVRPDRTTFIQQLRLAFLSVDAVKRHIADPTKAFDEMMRINDGGASYIAHQLAQVCKPEIKHQQLRHRLSALRERLQSLLQKFYVSNDIEGRLRERNEVAEKIIDAFYKVETPRLGTLLRGLMVEQGQLTDRFLAVLTSQEGLSTSSSVLTSRPNPRPGRPSNKGMTTTQSFGAPVRSGKLTALANAGLGTWIDSMSRQAENEHFCSGVALDAPLMIELIREISVASRRLNLDAQIASRLEAHAHEEKLDVLATKAALVAVRLINAFVADLGWSNVAPSERPRIPIEETQSEEAIYLEQPSTHTIQTLPVDPPDYRSRYFTSWMFGFHQLVQDNAQSENGITINIEQNDRLGATLERLRGTI